MKTYDLVGAAKLLHMSQSALRQKANAGEIPGSKPGKKWVFLRSDLIRYLRSRAAAIAARPAPLTDSSTCLSTNAKTHGGFGLRGQVESEYANLLGLRIGKRRRNTTT